MKKDKTVEKQVKEIVDRYGAEKSSLIAILQDMQGAFGYLPKDALIFLNEVVDVPLARIYEVATFYNAFSLTPRGKYLVEVCAGTACHVTGALTLMERLERDLEIRCGETTGDGMFTLEQVRCLGCCSLAPVMRIGGNIHAYLTQDEIPKILRNYRQ
ncbi:MAG: NADH-quinone oxidoreductase subunit NuoE [Syntrophobacterales bacterium CG_4_8_14_3_um_filter_58_8]|nr:MAG: NAD(P)H-dependent oxidoreductase subunit E [Syntrophaceae bacterium CG2_30_58_14]PIV02112.1 MAG: NADH-quinone oxidoreductase subunit NuoE [Syntrophobacterales bacterium CG03_land_8_20_14_0_80_58_14]PJC75586.1 MAG: NADH-quinone oxidoreductase subunit NuoE [Syntrophobacterales bacterium CG_4_8_14_3_um_filter_58_8]